MTRLATLSEGQARAFPSVALWSWARLGADPRRWRVGVSKGTGEGDEEGERREREEERRDPEGERECEGEREDCGREGGGDA